MEAYKVTILKREYIQESEGGKFKDINIALRAMSLDKAIELVETLSAAGLTVKMEPQKD